MKLPKRKLHSIKRLSLLIASAYALAPSNAVASQFLSAGGGINLGITFTKNHGMELSYGIETFLTHQILFNESSYYYEPTYAFGPTFQLNHTTKTGWKAMTGLVAGVSNDEAIGYLAELGASYQFNQKQWGGRAGVIFEPQIFNFALRHDFFIEETSISVGGKIPNYFGFPINNTMVTEGRPLRTTINDHSRQNRFEINNLATKWADTAQDEYEAIFAFGNLAFELIQAGAPEQLIEKAINSAEQEIEHAMFCANQAKKIDDTFELKAPDDVFRKPVTAIENLERLAFEGLIDGWQGEGLAAQTMSAGAKKANNEHLRQSLLRIASEETGHANLGLQVAKWAMHQDTTGRVRSKIATLRQSDLGQLEAGFFEEKEGFVKPNEIQRHFDQIREELDAKINEVLVN